MAKYLGSYREKIPCGCGCGEMIQKYYDGYLSQPRKFKRGHWTKVNFLKFKGFRTQDKRGYIMRMVKDHPYRDHDDYVYEHRLVMEAHLGRYLDPKELVHHINEEPWDNRIENLQIMSKGDHQRLHIRRKLFAKMPV